MDWWVKSLYITIRDHHAYVVNFQFKDITKTVYVPFTQPVGEGTFSFESGYELKGKYVIEEKVSYN